MCHLKVFIQNCIYTITPKLNLNYCGMGFLPCLLSFLLKIFYLHRLFFFCFSLHKCISKAFPLSCVLIPFSLPQMLCKRFGVSWEQSSVRRTLTSGWHVKTTGFPPSTCRRPRPVASTTSLLTLTLLRRLVNEKWRRAAMACIKHKNNIC